MKTTFNVDEKRLEEANTVHGTATGTDTVRPGLEALVRQAAYERMRAFRGSEKNPEDIPRRREPAAAKRPVA